MEINKLREMDVKYLWHPYTDIDTFEKTDFPVIKKAKGCYIYDSNGKKYLDGIASWWCVNFGHSHPALVKAIRKQAKKLQNVILGGMSHEKAILLSKKIAEVTPKGLNHSFYASDGSSAVEAALRMALQYWENVGEKNRKKFICLEDGYHGDTLGSIGVGYVDVFHKELSSVVNDNYRAASPHCAQCSFGKHPKSCNVECFSSMQELIEKHCQETAAVIVEPLCQGAGGIRIYPELYLKKLRELCSKHNVLLITDEIAVGFARTGKMFACDTAGIVPDIMTIGKGLTGGYLPMSAAVVTDKIYDSFRRGNTLYHGHTYCGNPIVSAVALKALELYEEENILEHIKPLQTIMEQEIENIAKLLPNSFSQSKGMIGMIEINEKDGGAKRAKSIVAKAMEMGLFIRPLGAVIYIWPPLVIKEKEFRKLFEILKKSVQFTS